ncbi:MAG: beta-lactamase family protein [Roseivirga sp.]|nr:beta-lactamase family protein [Roseivirga sp.]
MPVNLRTSILLIAFFISQPHTGRAQDLNQSYTELLSAQFSDSGPGATALVAVNGQIVYYKAFGKANLELGVDMKADMKFMIGSVTKQFTAVSVLMLMEQGKLNLNDDITKYLPDYPAHGHHITIHHLLTHTSGIANSVRLVPWDADVRKRDFEPEELVNYFKNEAMRSVPGERYRYNNFGYHILGYIIEKVSGQRYDDFVRTNIFEPLGMKNSRYGSHVDNIPNRAYGYTRNDGFKNAEYVNLSQVYAAGALMSTVQDLLIWNSALINNKLISKKSLQLAWSNYDLNSGKKINYGYGWFVNEINGSHTIEHAGGISGFQTNVIYLPQEDVFVAVFSNCDATDPRPVSTRMAALAIGKPYPAPEAIIQPSDEALLPWVGNYDYEDGSTRIVELINHQLYWYRPGRKKFKLLAISSDHFILENTFTYVKFQHNEESVEAFVTARIVNRKATRTISNNN